MHEKYLPINFTHSHMVGSSIMNQLFFLLMFGLRLRRQPALIKIVKLKTCTTTVHIMLSLGQWGVQWGHNMLLLFLIVATIWIIMFSAWCCNGQYVEQRNSYLVITLLVFTVYHFNLVLMWKINYWEGKNNQKSLIVLQCFQITLLL